MQAGEVLEIALPVKGLGHEVSFQIVVTREQHGNAVELERHPARGPITLAIPHADYDARHWSS